MRAHRAAGRLFRFAEALSQCGFLYRAHLSIDGVSDDDVSGTFRDSAHFGLDRSMAGNAARCGTENRAAAAYLSGIGRGGVCANGEPRLSKTPPAKSRRIKSLLNC